jgi:hypothetical protein
MVAVGLSDWWAWANGQTAQELMMKQLSNIKKNVRGDRTHPHFVAQLIDGWQCSETAQPSKTYLLICAVSFEPRIIR